MEPKTFMVLDTETLVSLEQPHVFDIGLVICDKKGNIKEEYQACVRETVTNFRLIKASMDEGHPYIHKLFYSYIPKFAKGKIPIKSWGKIQKEINALAEKHRVNVLAAYNLEFDKQAMSFTHRTLGKKSRRYFDRKMATLDLWKMSELVTKAKPGKQYIKACLANGSLTAKGNVQTSAQAVARYLLGQWELIEDHTALADARLEAQLMARLFAHKKRVPYGKMATTSVALKAQPNGWGSATKMGGLTHESA